jgi:hypothetical protein
MNDNLNEFQADLQQDLDQEEKHIVAMTAEEEEIERIALQDAKEKGEDV